MNLLKDWLNMQKRYNDFNSWLRKKYNCRVQKITVDAGLSCPNRDGKLSYKGCIYCNTKGSGTGAFSKGISIKDQIVNGKIALKKRYKAKKFLVYFQSFTNTYAPFETLKDFYDQSLEIEDIIGLSIGTRPDCVEDKVLDLLQYYAETKLIWIEYGIQSVHDSTLNLINRGHNFKDFENMVSKTKNRGIKICSHVILGLPGENKTKMLQTAKTLANIGIDGVKIHLLYVIKDTKLHDIYNKGEYKCLKQEEYVDIVCDFLEILPKNIVIQRLTGDPHLEELVAPIWSKQKTETLNLIKNKLELKNSYQGKYHQK